MKKVRYGILGASGIAHRRVLPAFLGCAHSELTAICSRSQARAQELAGEFQAPWAFDQLDEMLPKVDAVYVATPVHCHFADAARVLAAGRHVLLEKPLARNPAEGLALLELAGQSRAFGMEAYMMKFHPAHQAIRETLLSQQIGRIVYARARLGCWYPDQPGAWRQDPELGGGGALVDLGSHLIDLLRWMLGPIHSVRALCNTQVFEYRSEDSATLLLEFQSGAHGVVEAYFSFPDQAGTGVLEITGTRGRVVAENTIGQNGDGRVRWDRFPDQQTYNPRQDAAGNGAQRTVEYARFDLYAAQLDYFSSCILQNQPPALNRLEDGVETLQWIARAYEDSARS